jgi:uncharacterized membrane protein YczE
MTPAVACFAFVIRCINSISSATDAFNTKWIRFSVSIVAIMFATGTQLAATYKRGDS